MAYYQAPGVVRFPPSNCCLCTIYYIALRFSLFLSHQKFNKTTLTKRPTTLMTVPLRSTFSFCTNVQQHENVAVIFSDLCGFTKLSGGLQPLQVIELLTCLWQKFDGLTNNLGNVTKVNRLTTNLLNNY